MKRIITTDKAPKAIGPYSQAVEVNGILFVSGQIAIDPATGELVQGGTREQTTQVMENIRAILAAAGYSFSNVVKMTCILSDIADFKIVNEVYGTYFSSDYPARAVFEAACLPRMARIEIETIAMKA